MGMRLDFLSYVSHPKSIPSKNIVKFYSELSLTRTIQIKQAMNLVTEMMKDTLIGYANKII